MKNLHWLCGIVLLCFLGTSPCSAQDQRVTLRIAGDEWFLRSLTGTGLVPSFEKNSGLKVEVSFKSDREIMTDLDRSSAADGGVPDIIVIRHRFLGALEAKHEVQPIDLFLTDRSIHDEEFRPDVWLFDAWWRELSSYNGHFYGFPFTALTPYLCYRKDLIDDAANRRQFRAHYHHELRVPENWNEYLELAHFLIGPRIAFTALTYKARRAWHCGMSG